MIPGGAIVSGSGAIGGAGIFQNPDYGQSRDGSVTLGRDPMNRSGRYKKFSDALSAAAGYKQKARAEAEAKKDVEDDDEKNTQGFKISPDAFVIEGYRDPGYTIAGQPGRSFLGPVGAAVGIFNPALGRGISAAGSLTGL